MSVFNPGADDANIGVPATDQQIDMQSICDRFEPGPDEPRVYEFSRNRYFIELEPY